MPPSAFTDFAKEAGSVVLKVTTWRSLGVTEAGSCGTGARDIDSLLGVMDSSTQAAAMSTVAAASAGRTESRENMGPLWWEMRQLAGRRKTRQERHSRHSGYGMGVILVA